MINRIKNFLKYVFMELPKQMFIFVKTFKAQFPIIFTILVFYNLGFRIIRGMFKINWIVRIIIDILFKLGVSIYINYNIVHKKCKDHPEITNYDIFKRTMIDSIIVLGSTILSEYTFRYFPILGIFYSIMRMIPLVGLPFATTFIFLLESFIYTYTVEKPPDYCASTSSSSSDFKKLFEKYKNFIMGKIPIIITLSLLYLLKYYAKSKLRPSQFRFYYGDEDEDDDYDDDY
jgi:hypothetical protein